MNEGKYKSIFVETFGIGDTFPVNELKYRQFEKWDSIGHMMLCAAIEDAYDFHFTGDEILEFQCYEDGKTILSRHGLY